MKPLSTLITNNPVKTLLSLLLITIGLGYGLTKLETRNNYDSELPKDDPIISTNNKIKDIFGEKEVILIGIESDDIFKSQTLEKIANISDELKLVQGVIPDEITSLTTINDIAGKEWGIEIGKLIKKMPENDLEMMSLKKAVLSNNLVSGRIISEDASFSLIIAPIEKGYQQATVYNQVKEIVNKFEGPEKLYAAGNPIGGQEVDLGIQKDVSTLLPLALLFIIIGFSISFRTIRGVLIPLAVVFLSIIWTMGIMGLTGLPVTVVSSVIPVLMIAVSSSYGIHILHMFYEESKENEKKDAVKNTIKKIGPAIGITGVTSAVGAFTLIIFKVVSIKEFGIISAIGMLNIVVISLALVPAMSVLLKEPKKTKQTTDKPSWFDKILLKIAAFSVKKAKLIVAISIAVIAVSAVGISKINIGGDFIKDFPTEHPLRIAFNKLNEQLGGARFMDIMVNTEEVDGIKKPEVLKQIAQFQDYIDSLEYVAYSSSFAEIIKRINKEMNEGNNDYNVIPDSQNLIAQYLLLYSMAGDPGDFSSLVDYDYQRAKIRVMLTTSNQEVHLQYYEKFKTYAKEHFPESVKIELGGEALFWVSQVRYIVMGKLQNILLALGSVLFLCIVILRSFKQGLLSLVPLTLSSLFTFGFMGFVGIRLEMGTAIITAMCVGIGIDFAIHYIYRFKREFILTGNNQETYNNTILSSGKAILFDVLSNILGFIVFIFSGFLPIRNFGWLISLTMITVSLITLTLLPALLSLTNKKQKLG